MKHIKMKSLITESKESRNLKSLKRNDFPEKWSLKDMVDRYEDDIWEYLWNDKGRSKEYGYGL